MDFFLQNEARGWLYFAAAIAFAIWCLLIAERKGMDRFTALLAGGVFGIMGVIYYALADPSKRKAIVMICGTIVLVNK
jgi:uncharacterized membrane protein YeiH